MRQLNNHENFVENAKDSTTAFGKMRNNLSKKDVVSDHNGFTAKIVSSFNRLCHIKYEVLYTPKYIKIEEDISLLHKKYVTQFSRLARSFETWAEQRRLLIKKLRDSAKRIDSLKRTSCKSRLTFSMADAVGSLGALVMGQLKPELAPKMLYTAGFLGCVGFALSIADHIQTNKIVEDLVDQYRIDIDSLEKIWKMFQTLNDFHDSVQELFPHGVDQLSIAAVKTRKKEEGHILNEYKEVTKELFPHDENMDICLAVLFSNGKRNPKLLEDDDFLATAFIFSRSEFAEKWWNRTAVEDRLLFSQPKGLLHQLKSLAKKDSFPIQCLPLLSTPAVYMNGMSTLIPVLLNGLVVLDASLELAGKDSTKESEMCRKLGECLQKELKEFEAIYELLNPYND